MISNKSILPLPYSSGINCIFPSPGWESHFALLTSCVTLGNTHDSLYLAPLR
jgi:hypothetical protein